MVAHSMVEEGEGSDAGKMVGRSLLPVGQGNGVGLGEGGNGVNSGEGGNEVDPGEGGKDSGAGKLQARHLGS